jgi:long-subunit fatty acid transport protein
LGVGRKFNDNWSAAVTLGYEAAKGGFAPTLAPTDGSKSIGLGVTYTLDNLKISGGLRYVMLGNATTELPSILPNTWADNTATAVGVKIAFTF